MTCVKQWNHNVCKVCKKLTVSCNHHIDMAVSSMLGQKSSVLTVSCSLSLYNMSSSFILLGTDSCSATEPLWVNPIPVVMYWLDHCQELAVRRCFSIWLNTSLEASCFERGGAEKPLVLILIGVRLKSSNLNSFTKVVTLRISWFHALRRRKETYRGIVSQNYHQPYGFRQNEARIFKWL